MFGVLAKATFLLPNVIVLSDFIAMDAFEAVDAHCLGTRRSVR